ncbi:MAG: cation:proton antiporter [Bacteroidota bacterium]|nr:cation:proton antiporter [Bacteroidota bacterium]
MHELDILSELVLLLAVIIVVISIFRKINIPPLVGFLISGLIIGPYGIKLVRNIEAVNVLAEVGVVLLLFTIGLEFSLTRLKRIKKIVLIGGGLQVLITIFVVTFLQMVIGLEFRQSLFVGFLISLSSTAIVMKLLTDKAETDTPHGKISLGILLFQDLCIVPMMLLVPVLAAASGTTALDVILKFVISLVGIGAIIVAAIYLMPKLVEFLVLAKSRELFVIGVVFLSLGTALVTSYVGLSLALGAFIAGLILSESEYSHEIVGAALPFRDALSSLFFISIGMLVNINLLFEKSLLLIIVSSAIIVIKFFIAAIVVLFLSFPARTAIIVGLSLSQIGEFSFILALAGISSGLMSNEIYQMFLGASIITMMLTPLFIQFSTPTAHFFQKILPQKLTFKFFHRIVADEVVDKYTLSDFKNHVIIVGYGLNGKNVASVLKETGIKYLIVDLSGETVKAARKLGENVLYGDATRREMLLHLGIEAARVLVIAISDSDAMRRILKIARNLNPDLHIISRTRTVAEIEDLYKLGSSEVIPEEFETSIEIFTRVLRQYHLPRNIIAAQVDLIRREGYGMFRGLKLPDATMDQITAILVAGTTDTFLVLNESPARGKTLADLNLRLLSGCSVIAVVRDNKPTTNPPPDFIIESGDVMVLLGTHAEIDKAFDLLSPPRMEEG